ncbi:ogr/Delta-like zinc finger family protein [Aeromonas hydrophila]|uniref:ogr/Delta-like zinc finger family protein n=1 Tax=Aeromonas hydrophila TaxID=644 RepID=UPI003D1AD4FE
MRVYCTECGQRGRVTKTNKMSSAVSDLYCQCTDAECGHSWVSTLAFNHTLSPSSRGTEEMTLRLIRALGPELRQRALKELGAL